MDKVTVSLKKVNVDYDEEADVLYLSFGEPREAADSMEVEDGIVYRISNNEVVGITVTNFNTRVQKTR